MAHGASSTGHVHAVALEVAAVVVRTRGWRQVGNTVNSPQPARSAILEVREEESPGSRGRDFTSGAR